MTPKTAGAAVEAAPHRAQASAPARPARRAGPAAAFVALAAGAGAFAAITAAARATPGRLDVEAMRIAGQVPPAVVAALGLLTHLGSVPVALALALALGGGLYRQRAGRELAGLALAVGAGQGLVYAMKAVFGRARPEAAALLDTVGHSFPSGHAFTAATLYGFVLYLVWRRQAPRPLRLAASVGLPLLVVLIAASRVVLGAHYLTDVAGGVVLGLLWLTACLVLLRAAARASRPLGGGGPPGGEPRAPAAP